ncbi:unnamed protein product, partial [marine sediment metagenome]
MKLTLKQIRKAILTIALILISGGVGYWLGTNQLKITNDKFKIKSFKIINKGVPADKDLDFSLFWKVWAKLGEKYLVKKDLDEKKMFYGAIQGMTASLGDPYTV